MEIPSDWYVYILPGLVILSSLVPLMKLEGDRIKIVLDSNLLGSALILGLVGYIVGFAANAISVEIIKPSLNYVGLLSIPDSSGVDKHMTLLRLGKGEILTAIQTSYQGMVLYRLLFGAFLCLSLTSICGLIWRRDNRAIRIVVLIAVVLATTALWRHWLAYRTNHYKFVNAGFESVQQSGVQQK